VPRSKRHWPVFLTKSPSASIKNGTGLFFKPNLLHAMAEVKRPSATVSNILVARANNYG
jgi:hypothetical protein